MNLKSRFDIIGKPAPETMFTLPNGDVVKFAIPWTADEKDLDLCEEIFKLQVDGIRAYRKTISRREEWWLRNRHFGP